MSGSPSDCGVALTGPQIDRLFAMGAMKSAPCVFCGYNGPGYYQPETHPCAERHHRLNGCVPANLRSWCSYCERWAVGPCACRYANASLAAEPDPIPDTARALGTCLWPAEWTKLLARLEHVRDEMRREASTLAAVFSHDCPMAVRLHDLADEQGECLRKMREGA